MLGAIQARAIRLDCVEQQRAFGAISHWVRDYGDRVARLERRGSPALTDHKVDA